jgi:hypothetical protein
MSEADECKGKRYLVGVECTTYANPTPTIGRWVNNSDVNDVGVWLV